MTAPGQSSGALRHLACRCRAAVRVSSSRCRRGSHARNGPASRTLRRGRRWQRHSCGAAARGLFLSLNQPLAVVSGRTAPVFLPLRLWRAPVFLIPRLLPSCALEAPLSSCQSYWRALGPLFGRSSPISCASSAPPLSLHCNEPGAWWRSGGGGRKYPRTSSNALCRTEVQSFVLYTERMSVDLAQGGSRDGEDFTTTEVRATMRDCDRRSVHQLDFERRALEARLRFAGGEGAHADKLIKQIEDADLTLAASPATDIAELAVKFDRMLVTMAFDVSDQSSLEAVFLSAINVISCEWRRALQLESEARRCVSKDYLRRYSARLVRRFLIPGHASTQCRLQAPETCGFPVRAPSSKAVRKRQPDRHFARSGTPAVR